MVAVCCCFRQAIYENYLISPKMETMSLLEALGLPEWAGPVG